MHLLKRMLAPKTVFFKRLQLINLFFALLCFVVVAAPGHLPPLLRVTAGYFYAAGVSAALVCQLTIGGKENKSKTNGQFIAKRK